MTDRELLADLLDSSVVKARKHLKETGQIENKDVIPLVLHDYHSRFDSIDKQLNEVVTLINEDLITKKEFNEHMATLDQRVANVAGALTINTEGVRSAMTETKWLFLFSAAVITIIFAVSKGLFVN
jgi:hypothetical protein